MTKYLIPFFAKMDGIDNFLKLAENFYNSAFILYGYCLKGLSDGQSVGKPTPEFYNNQFVPPVYLYRHAIELAMKALIETINQITLLLPRYMI